jgi:hypothetical protein
MTGGGGGVGTGLYGGRGLRGEIEAGVKLANGYEEKTRSILTIPKIIGILSLNRIER